MSSDSKSNWGKQNIICLCLQNIEIGGVIVIFAMKKSLVLTIIEILQNTDKLERFSGLTVLFVGRFSGLTVVRVIVLYISSWVEKHI